MSVSVYEVIIYIIIGIGVYMYLFDKWVMYGENLESFEQKQNNNSYAEYIEQVLKKYDYLYAGEDYSGYNSKQERVVIVIPIDKNIFHRGYVLLFVRLALMKKSNTMFVSMTFEEQTVGSRGRLVMFEQDRQVLKEYLEKEIPLVINEVIQCELEEIKQRELS